jgi:tetratricopeptide (TPR) repeat protein
MAAEHEHWEEVYFQANQAYKEGRFQEAIDGYRQLIQSGHGSGHIYYNLGNGYIRLHQLGKAILNYERARLLLPRDADLDFNLRYARDHIRDKVPEVRNTMSIIFFWLRSLTLSDLFWGFAVLNTLFWGILCLRIFYRSEWTYYLILTILTVWLITGLSLGLKWYQLALDDRAVVVPEEVNVLAGPDVNDTVLFKLHEGTLVHCERSEDGWVLVRFQDGKRGWVQADGIENIRI